MLSDQEIAMIRNVAMFIVTIVVIPVLNSWKKKLDAEAASHAGVLSQSLRDHVSDFLFSGASAIAQQKLPQLAIDIVAGKYRDQMSVERELQSWGKTLKQQALVYFQKTGVDLIQQIGDNGLDILIQNAANTASPFPGAKTSSTLIDNPKLAVTMSKWGVAQAREEFNKLADEHVPAAV